VDTLIRVITGENDSIFLNKFKRLSDVEIRLHSQELVLLAINFNIIQVIMNI